MTRKSELDRLRRKADTAMWILLATCATSPFLGMLAAAFVGGRLLRGAEDSGMHLAVIVTVFVLVFVTPVLGASAFYRRTHCAYWHARNHPQTDT